MTAREHAPVAEAPAASTAWREPDWRSIVQHAPHLVARFDASGRLVFLNPAAHALLGSLPGWAGRTCEQLAEAHAVFSLWGPRVRRAVARGAAYSGDAEIRTPGGDAVLRFHVVPEHRDRGAPGALVYASDVSGERQREPRHAQWAGRDPLSGVYDRSAFLARLEDACARGGSAPDEAFAVLFIDLDRFKSVNDHLGHAAGDAVLRIVGERLLACIRPGDVVGRLGGDEFAVLLRGVHEVADAARAVERIQARVAERIDLAGTPARVTASVGLVIGAGAADPHEILRGADRAMYAAKTLGEGYYQVLDPLDAQVQAATEMLDAALGEAIAGDQLTLHYQPIVSLSDSRLLGIEALVRWIHPDRGVLGPQAFLPVAEQTGRICDLDRWVLRTAIRQIARWREVHGIQPLPVNVNVSARLAACGDLGEYVRGLLREHALEPAHLIVEITETALLDLGRPTLASLAELREAGVAIALDDFGTGFSSLSHLRTLPVDMLKVAPSFVQRIVEDGTDRAIVGGVLALARSLGLDVVTEGIERPEQRDVLRALGCERGQGYLFGRPMEARALEPLLAARAREARVAPGGARVAATLP